MKSKRSPVKTALALGGLGLLSACAAGPDYQRPAFAVPAHYASSADWKTATPNAASPSAAWWNIYGDPELNALVNRVELSNENLRAAEARYRAAQALLAASRSSLFPTLGASLDAARKKNPGKPASTTTQLGLELAWEPDLWGRLRRQTEADRSEAEASAADLAAAKLSLQASLVQTYLQLRVTDALQGLFKATTANNERALEITRNRYQAGMASQADVAQAESLLKSTEAQALEISIQRAQFEHAIAVLLGRLPSELRITPANDLLTLPAIPSSLPSALLEKRPDIASAERRVAAANARIGLAQSAYFPRLTLAASGGYEHDGLADLIAAPHRFWALGPAALTLDIFDGGARKARRQQAEAIYDESVANYRQSVLTAFQEVEDRLSALTLLAREKTAQDEALRAARRYQDLTKNQYLAGTVSYLNVNLADTAALNAERDSLNVLGRQLQTSVQLVKALGGGDWSGGVR